MGRKLAGWHCAYLKQLAELLAMQEAYAQCQTFNKIVKVLETIDAKPPYILGNFPKTEIRFKCVAEQ
ncbi:hypothetical protein [Alteromonas sp. 5E99-2]|uniref:hypothetical protein n=1 Tax=Alteromonas sp. 5E99-2 TaxID=2817683 RepID=UPI001A993F58|nr:hypothetical protein [Alteromonas sp. 5E99-2]